MARGNHPTIFTLDDILMMGIKVQDHCKISWSKNKCSFPFRIIENG